MDHSNMKMPAENYKRLLSMGVLSFLSMYILMYSMADSLSNVYSSWNQFYMAMVMAAPMIIIEIVLMKGMYRNKKLNTLIVAGSAVALIVFFTMIRQQTGITDKQFLRSMIPHHAGAILMCEESPADNPVIKGLCKDIISSQKKEIEQMRGLLEDLEK